MIEYRTCRRLSLWTNIFLAVLSLTILVSFFVTLSEIQTLDKMEAGEVVSEKDRSEIADRQASINFLSLIANVAVIIAILMWIYRASKNLKHLHVDGQRFSPLWAGSVVVCADFLVLPALSGDEGDLEGKLPWVRNLEYSLMEGSARFAAAGVVVGAMALGPMDGHFGKPYL